MVLAVIPSFAFNALAADGGYYVIGNMTDWSLNADYKLSEKLTFDFEEYVIENVSLTTSSQFKIVYSPDGSDMQNWYPEGMGNNFGENCEITEDGKYNIYFRPDGLGDESWHNGYFRVEPVTEYDLWVGGVQVNEENCEDIIGDGSVVFDADTSTLTLTDANLKGCDSASGLYGVINSLLPELTIELQGENIIDGEYNNDGIDAAGGCNVILTGNGSLDINNSYYGTYIGSWEVDGGDLTIEDEAKVTVTNSSAAGIWVNHDINFLADCIVTVSRTGSSYNGVVSNVGGTITVDGGDLTVENPKNAVHFGNTDDSEHAFNMVSGYATITSTEGYGIYCEPASSTGDINGAITVDGGRLEINSVSGASNIEDIAINRYLTFTTGESFDDANIVIAPATVTVNLDANGGTKGAAWVDSFEIPADEFEVGSLLNPPEILVSAPEGFAFDALEVNGVRVEIGETPEITGDTVNVKFLWISTVKNGWVQEDGTWFYYTDDEAATGWKQIKGVWYYFNADGAMQTGWLKDGSKWYYLKSSGAMATGWVKDNGKWYYMNSSGAMQTGWQKIGGTWYYFYSTGAMKAGSWLKDGNDWYFFKADGSMAVGWVQQFGKWYYMNKSGAMLANTSIRLNGKTYKFNNDGVCINP